MVIFYHLMSFSDFVLDPETKFIMGYSLLVFIGILIALNIGISLKNQLMNMLRERRMKKTKADREKRWLQLDMIHNPEKYIDRAKLQRDEERAIELMLL